VLGSAGEGVSVGEIEARVAAGGEVNDGGKVGTGVAGAMRVMEGADAGVGVSRREGTGWSIVSMKAITVRTSAAIRNRPATKVLLP
jgi:hypothetical protein